MENKEVYNKTIKFEIDGIEIELVGEKYSNDCMITHYIIDNHIFLLGEEPPDIQSAIQAYERFFNVKLSDSKVHQLFTDQLR